MNIILEAARIAEEAHRDQRRKYGAVPYIHHPARVALAVSSAPLHVISKAPHSHEELVAAAWLHDVIEDCPPVWIGHIASKMPVSVLKLVTELTDQYTSSVYPNLNREFRKAKEAERLGTVTAGAVIIKLADLIDNLQDIPREEGFYLTMSREVGRLHDFLGRKVWPEASAYLDTLLHPEWNLS